MKAPQQPPKQYEKRLHSEATGPNRVHHYCHKEFLRSGFPNRVSTRAVRT